MIKQKKLRKLLHYNPDTGVFIRKKTLGSTARKGDVCGGYHNQGYLRTMINGKNYLMHRLAWLYMYGYFPEFIDHVNHDRKDNRICNLREVTRTENQQNMSKRIDNVSGVTGVSWDKSRNRWTSRIRIDDKYKYLGRFIEFSEAVNARNNAEILYGFHINHGA